MKAIETKYKGYRFRSRLEARWAVFFDALGIKWQYEPEGFMVDDETPYLPDFYVHMREDHESRIKHPNAGYWIEVKPAAPNAEEVRKLQAVCSSTMSNGYFFCGVPGELPVVRINAIPPLLPMSKEAQEAFEFLTSLIKKRDRDFLSGPIGSLVYSAAVDCCMDGDLDIAKVGMAIQAARSARFEFGECGAAA